MEKIGFGSKTNLFDGINDEVEDKMDQYMNA